jgi:hypothetical protein
MPVVLPYLLTMLPVLLGGHQPEWTDVAVVATALADRVPQRGERLSETIEALGVPVESIYVDHFPAYTFYLRAQVTPDQWHSIERLVEKDWTRAKRQAAWPIWLWQEAWEPKPQWWNPSDATEGALFVSRKRHDAALKYENGFLYYWSRGD